MHDTTTDLILPGLGNSGPDHWQSHWERRDPACRRVAQSEWDAPIRADWVAYLDAVLLEVQDPVVLVGHSTGCALVAHWAVQAPPLRLMQVRGALLVAPSDPDGANYPPEPKGFSPLPLVRLPFPTVVVASTNDPYVSASRAQDYATAWGSRFVLMRDAGHLNVAAGFGPWPDGWELLTTLREAPRADDAFPPWLASDEALDAFMTAFRNGTFPIAWWTHGAHVAMAATILWETPVSRALIEIRDAIRSYNERQGGENTATSGYHETLTRLWVGVVASALASIPDDTGRLNAARYAFRTFGHRATLFRDCYGYDLLASAEARRSWVPPGGDCGRWFGGS